MDINKRKILLVEDEPLIAMLEKRQLENMGYSVQHVSNGEEAIQQALNNSASFAVILMDIDLGLGIDGTQAAEKILNHKDIPIVFLSSHTEPEVVEKTEKITSYGYVVKNSGIVVLNASIKMALKLFDSKLKEQKKEESLRQSEERIRDLVTHSSEGIYRVDIAPPVPISLPREELIEAINKRAVLSEVNEALSSMYGLRPEEMVGRPATDFSPDYGVRASFVLDAERNSVKKMETRDLDKDGNVVFLIENFYGEIKDGELLRIWGLQDDITERKQAEQALRKSEAIKNAMVSNIGDVIVIIDPNGIIKYKSPNITKLFGWTPEELIGKSVWDNLHPNCLEDAWDFFRVILTEPNATGTTELLYKRKDGEYVWIEISVINLLHDQYIQGILGNYHDITERKRAEILLQEKSVKFEAQNEEFAQINEELNQTNNELFKVNEIIEETKIRLELAIDAGDHGFWDWNLITNNTYFSPSYYTMLGYFDKELPMNLDTFMKLIHKDDTNIVMPIVQNSIEAGKPYEVEFRLKCKDGSFKWILGKGKSYYNGESGKPNRAVGVHIDINDRKKMEEELRISKEKAEESEERYRRLLTNLEAGVVVHAKDTSIILCNTRSSELLGLSTEQMNGKVAIDPYWKFINEDNAKLALNDYPVMRIINSKKAIRNQIIGVCRKLNDVIWLMVNGFPTIKDDEISEIIISFIDITEQKRADETLRRKNEELSTLLDALPVMTWISLDSECRHIIGNRAVTELFGVPSGANLSQSVVDKDLSFKIKHLDSVGRELCADQLPMQQAIATGQPVLNKELTYELPDGHRIYALGNAVPLYEDTGRVRGAIGAYIDISERKRSEKKIEKQLIEKETLLKEVHHRVKNNIVSIESLLSMQLQSIRNPEAISALQNAITRVQGLRILYDKLLIGKDYQDVSVKAYTESLIDAIVAVFPESENVAIEKQIMDFNLNAKSIVHIGIIINELLTNVFKYAFKGRSNGSVSISIEKIENKITLIVNDNGIGINERIVENKSPGFGLTIIKMLVEQQKGTYHIVNKNGTQSIIEFEL